MHCQHERYDVSLWVLLRVHWRVSWVIGCMLLYEGVVVLHYDLFNCLFVLICFLFCLFGLSLAHTIQLFRVIFCPWCTQCAGVQWRTALRDPI
jgi:hypothetical protein